VPGSPRRVASRYLGEEEVPAIVKEPWPTAPETWARRERRGVWGDMGTYRYRGRRRPSCASSPR